MFGARPALVLVAAAASTLVAGSASASAMALPNPCTILPSSTVAATVGLGGVALKGVRSGNQCTYLHGTAKLEISVGVGGTGGGAPGMVTTKPPGIGNGSFTYDTRPGDQFAIAIFFKNNDGVTVWSNGQLPDAKVLALARLVYKALSG